MAKNPKRPKDPNQLAALITGIAAGEKPNTKPQKKDENASALGKKGGAARAKNLTPEQRKEIAKKAAKSRWDTQT